jgi:hypothetical protein
MAIGSVAAEVPVIPIPKERLLEEDGVPLETDWHRLEMNLLIEVVTNYWRDREDYYVGGNMFIYYNEEHARNADCRGPDFFWCEILTSAHRAPIGLSGWRIINSPISSSN